MAPDALKPNCPQCGGPVPVPEGAAYAHCSFCGSESFVDLNGALLYQVIKPTVGRPRVQRLVQAAAHDAGWTGIRIDGLELRIVMKFGGTSMADLERIRSVAGKVQAEVEDGNEVVVAVSAMAGVTNQLADYADQAAGIYDLHEYDVVVSSGEQVSAGILAIVLQDLGVAARSWLGWQIPIRTDDSHGSARIEDIDVDEILRRLSTGQVAVVAGFQGVDAQVHRLIGY